MHRYFSTILLLLAVIYGQSQNNPCEVLSDSLKGKYTGDCKNNKAHGMGKAEGRHTYEGEFKKGLPDGEGLYTWPNGDFWYGTWKKGMKAGRGIMVNYEKKDTLRGFWEKDNYKGLYETPWVLHSFGKPGVYAHYSINKIDGSKNNIVFNFDGSGKAEFFQSCLVTGGSFAVVNKMESRYQIEFQFVNFPFRVKFSSTKHGDIDLEIYEPGNWEAEFKF